MGNGKIKEYDSKNLVLLHNHLKLLKETLCN